VRFSTSSQHSLWETRGTCFSASAGPAHFQGDSITPMNRRTFLSTTAIGAALGAARSSPAATLKRLSTEEGGHEARLSEYPPTSEKRLHFFKRIASTTSAASRVPARTAIRASRNCQGSRSAPRSMASLWIAIRRRSWPQATSTGRRVQRSCSGRARSATATSTESTSGFRTAPRWGFRRSNTT